MKTRSAGDPRSQREHFESVQSEKRNGWAKQRRLKGGGSVTVAPGRRKATSRQNRVRTARISRRFGGLLRLDDIRGLRIQPCLRSRWLECTTRPKRHRVLFQGLPGHRALQFGAGRPVIDRRTHGFIRERVVIVPESLVLLARARDEIGNTSELRMATAQSDQTRGSDETTTEQDRAFRFTQHIETLALNQVARTLHVNAKLRIDRFDCGYRSHFPFRFRLSKKDASGLNRWRRRQRRSD